MKVFDVEFWFCKIENKKKELSKDENVIKLLN